MAEPAVRGAAVVGLGVGLAHVRALRRLRERFHLVAVCDHDQTRVDRVVERTGADALPFDEMLRRDDIEVIHLCTPPAGHRDQCVAALEAGKHVVCEKPLVASLADIDALARAESGSGRRLMPVFQYRFGRGLQQLRALVDNGVAGRAYTSSAEVAWRRRADYYATRWRGTLATELGGVLLSQAIHALDMLTFIVGPVTRVFCRTETLVNDVEVEDCAAASFEMADGSLATLTATLGSSQEVTRHRFHFANLSAESGTAPYTSSGEGWTITPDTDEVGGVIDRVLSGWTPAPEEWEGQLLRFADALDAGTELPVALADARAALEIVTAMYWSARTAQDVALPLTADHPFYKGWSE